MNPQVDKSENPQSSTICSAPRYQQDFPIEWEGDHYVSRREMVKFLTLGSLLLAVANWVTAFAKRWIRRDSSAVQLLGPATSLEANGSMLFRYPTADSPCIAIRTPQGALVAYSQVCTHLSCAVLYSNGQLRCPCHNGLFDPRTGDVIAGPPTRPLPLIQLAQEGDTIYAVKEILR